MLMNFIATLSNTKNILLYIVKSTIHHQGPDSK